MSREVRRVPTTFDWPINEIWQGYLRPNKFDEDKCPDCKSGRSPQAQHLRDLWYGYLPFDPESTGSTALRHDTPAVRAFAERNIGNAPDFYGTGEPAIVREARRLAELWNGMCCHHLAQDDVDALVAAGRLMDFTHTWSAETRWQKIDPPVVPTAAQVNEWSLRGFGHDGINASIAVSARCEREGFADTCSTCQGHGSVEAYPGQRAAAEAWERTDPPTGDGWQLWETVSEGSPISPVFGTPELLAGWMASPAYTWGASKHSQLSYETALRFVKAGWAPTAVASADTGLVSGVEYVGRHTGDET
ncbi:hypothetical protein [Kitasatospora kifunensis]|uniref:Uncharacterized protein n=1 Tax=Kitasatospora kifunensis TaxID=58351 RepID=A0A7W7VU18_KITKI|nr:hypothetical protein [Kitasatospora kifunensis]MBB4922199.1 hypothetical protein [Kitasatospora kifunensis]